MNMRKMINKLHSLNSENMRLSNKNKINLNDNNNSSSLTENKIIFNDEKSLESNNNQDGSDKSLTTPNITFNDHIFFEENNSESDENREFFKSIHNTVIMNNKSNDQTLLSKNLEEMMHLQKMFKANLLENKGKMKAELNTIQKAEGSHFGIKLLFIFLNAFLLYSNEIMRGESEDSFIDISQWSVGDWIILAIMWVSAIAIAVSTINYIMRIFAKKNKCRIHFNSLWYKLEYL